MKRTDMFFIYVKEFIEFNYLELKSENTIESYRTGLNDFRRFICNTKQKEVGMISFNDIDDIVIREYLKWIITNQKKLSTRNIRLTTLKQYIKFCASKRVELIPLELTILKIKSKTVRPKRHNWLSKKQVTLILDQCNNNRVGIRDRFIMLFMFSTGARLSEMLHTKLKDLVLHGEYPYLIFTGKGNKGYYSQPKSEINK